MAVLIRTGDVPANQRVDAWLSVVCDALGPLDVRDRAIGRLMATSSRT
jgi:hypothetical protein